MERLDQKGPNVPNGDLETDAGNTNFPEEDEKLLAQMRVADAEAFFSF